MALHYDVVERKNPRAIEQPGKYYASLKRLALVSEKELADRIALMCTVKAPDVRGVLIAMEEEIVRNLLAGNSIHMGELGILRNVIRSKGAPTKEEWDISRIKDVRTQFIQRKAIRIDLTSPDVKFEKIEYEEPKTGAL